MTTSAERDLPSGTVTFLFTDIEGSTRLARALGEAWPAVLGEHRRKLREAFLTRGGVEVDRQGDSFFVAFARSSDAVAAALAGQRALAGGPVSVRMGLHTGEPFRSGGGYEGVDVHKAARIAAAGHGGQVLLSKETRDLVAVDARDLGEHRLKDFDEPVWIFQLGSGRFAPLKTISNTNLPRPVSSFVGREREVHEVLAALRDGARLVTLTGPGGSGKTRLAVQAAADLVPDFRNGVFWVELAPLRAAALVAPAIARTLGAKDGLAEHIGERELLLLLDNFEQVIQAGPELASLVERCPRLTLLVTSRERLRVRGEVEYPVLPLTESEAIELFCVRARLEPDETVAELCRRLDSLPLALELAAARTSVLSPAQILDRLAQRLDLLEGGRDAAARQATLRATIDWSYDLLEEGTRKLFARLAVFAGGCTLQAAEEVAAAGLDALQSLVDKNLLRHTRDRFWMLETIREYALERLVESSEGVEVHRRHAEHVVAMAIDAEPHLRNESREWLDAVEREHDNLRAALGWLEAAGESELVLRLATAAWRFWSLRGHALEGRRRLESALRADERPTATRAEALLGLADMALDTGDRVTARRRAQEALALHRSLGNAWEAAYSLVGIGLTFAFDGDWPVARRHFEEGMRVFSELGDEHQTLQAMRRLAWTYDELGNHEQARQLYEEMLHRARASGEQFIEGKTLGVLAQQALNEARVDEAISILTEAHLIHRDRPDQPDRYADALLVCRFARLLVMREKPATAARLLSCFETLLEEIGVGSSVEGWVVKMNEGTIEAVRDELDAGAFTENWRAGRALTSDEAVALALDALG
jgi:predicted ATPase/class 3 adenylate cyclase